MGPHESSAELLQYSDNPYTFNHSSSPKKPVRKWIKLGIPLAILAIVGLIVGVVIGTRKNTNRSSSGAAGSAGSTGNSGNSPLSSAVSAKLAFGRFATGTNSEFLVPLYPSTTNTALFTSPTFINTTNSQTGWPQDPFQPSNPNVLTTREDRPLLIAPAYKWQALPNLIRNDPYLQGWNATIFGNATSFYGQPPVVYFLDSSNGILDIARDVKRRIKAFAYVYRMTNDTKWVDRTWVEIQNAAGNGSTPFGPAVDKWNTAHFLDTAEFCAAFAIAYDWLYDAWTDDQKSQMRSTLLLYGLGPGLSVYTSVTTFGWWSDDITGNWNCVCNSGLTMASLAILADDVSGTASQILGYTVNNAKENCALAVSSDGTWSETANYWYFGTTGHAEMSSSLQTATGSDYGLLDVNPYFMLTGQYHMNVFGATSLFNYGDAGPNKYSSTANSMFLYAAHYNMPTYALFQREQEDAAEPSGVFWYEPAVSGAFWDGLALDHFFDNGTDQWASMRSSWTDQHALYVAIKAGTLQGHQTHNDLDAGDFVMDALGTRWAGELGSGDYNSIDYFSNDTQGSARWLYYRKATEGQNTILIGEANQNVLASPTVNYASSQPSQGSSTVFNVPSNSSAYWITDMTSAYFNATSVKRGCQVLNKRRQVLIQDEITAQAPIQWRMHTNATVVIDGGTSATLTLDGQTMNMKIVNPPAGAVFTTGAAVRFASDPQPPEADQPNPGVTVLIISLPAGTYTLEVLFNPQWPGMSASDFITPSSVPLSSWSLSS